MEWTLTEKNDNGDWVRVSSFGSLHDAEEYLDAMDPTASGTYRLKSTRPPGLTILPFPSQTTKKGELD